MLDVDDGHLRAWVTHLVVRGTYLPGTVRCTAGERFRSAAYIRDEFDYEVNPRVIKCYLDVRANAYVLGAGPSTLTVKILNYIYWDGEYAPYAEEDQTEQEIIEEVRQNYETSIDDVFPGRENILFVGPAVDLSSEVWRVLAIWDVQRQEDSTVVAVHPGRNLWRDLKPIDYVTHRSALEMELPAFEQAGDNSESGSLYRV